MAAADRDPALLGGWSRSLGASAEWPLAPANRLLTALPADSLARLQRSLTPVTFATGEVLYQPDQPIDQVYFPLTAVVSLLTVMSDGTPVEAAAIGNQGMVGLPLFLGAGSDIHRAVVQLPGRLLCLPAGDFRAALADPAVQRIMRQFTLLLLAQLARAGACNTMHPIGQRCARWLLTTHQLVGVDEFPLTHTYLASVLAVRRASVTVAVGAMQQSGMLRYHRGRMHILDRERLEGSACPCYRAIRELTERLLTP